jgi:type IV pilus assembly protein PilV
MDKTNMTSPALRHLQRGVTMLEVLIAIVVLSFGLLGMLGLLTNGLKMTSSSQYRTIAAQQLTAIADIISANPDIVAAYSSLATNPTSTNPAANSCFTSNCTSSVSTNTTTAGTPPVTTTSTTITSFLPATDYRLWLNDLQAMLPQGSGTVCLDATPADGNSANFACDGLGRLTVKICWNEHARVAISGGGGGGAAGSASAQDTCLVTQL